MTRRLTPPVLPVKSLLLALAIVAGHAVADDAKPAPKPPAPKPGTIAGVVKDEQGNVIKDARVRVFVSGISGAYGQRNTFNFDVKDDGTYAIDIPDGVYKIWAEVDKDYNNRSYRLQLYPDDKRDWEAGYSSKEGVVKNFTFKTSGLKPAGDRKLPSAYYGSYVTFLDKNHYDDAKKLLGKYAKGNVVITFTPKGTLIDGSTVKPFDRQFPAKDFQRYQGQIFDIPLGDYSMSAKVVMPDKSEASLKLRPFNPGLSDEDNPMAAKTDLEFVQPTLSQSIQEVKMQVGVE